MIGVDHVKLILFLASAVILAGAAKILILRPVFYSFIDQQNSRARALVEDADISSRI